MDSAENLGIKRYLGALVAARGLYTNVPLLSIAQASRSPSRLKKHVTSKRSTAALIAQTSAAKASSHELTSDDINATIRSASDASQSLKTRSTISVNSAQSGEPSLENESLPSKHGYSLTDIYLSRDNLVQKALFAAVTGNGRSSSAYRQIRMAKLCLGRRGIYLKFLDRLSAIRNTLQVRPYLCNIPLTLLNDLLCSVLNCWLERFNMASLHLHSDPLLSRQVHMR